VLEEIHMGILDRKANRVWNDLDKYYGELVAGLPDTDGLGKPLDKPRILRAVRLVLAYGRDRGDQGGSEDESSALGRTLSRQIKFCEYQVWRNADPRNLAPVLLSFTEDALAITTQMGLYGYATAVAALGDITQIWMGVLSSTGRRDEFMVALQQYAQMQSNSTDEN
jgi:hypothetical protein